MHVTAPASSANLGPGFDTLGLALDLPFELIEGQSASACASGDASVVVPPGFLLAENNHPSSRAFVAAGGSPDTQLWWRSPIPPGRGIGFSGAARVAGAYLALLGVEPGSLRHSEADGVASTSAVVNEAFRVAALLEGHPDNAAASALGGMTVAIGGEAIRVQAPEGLIESLRVVTWSPAQGTSTDSSRTHLGEAVPLPVAISSIGRSSLWVAAVASGRLDLLREACLDELHQPARLAARPDTAATLEACLDSDEVLAAWLSGSGPTVAALLASEEAAGRLVDRLSGLPTGEGEPPMVAQETAKDRLDPARVRTLTIDTNGVRPVIPD